MIVSPFCLAAFFVATSSLFATATFTTTTNTLQYRPVVYSWNQKPRSYVEPYSLARQIYSQNVYEPTPARSQPVYTILAPPPPPRPMYAAPLYAAQYLAPSHQVQASTFAKRVDTIQPETPKPTCLHLHPMTSNSYPVYVLPPKDFQPIIYHQAGYHFTSLPFVYGDKQEKPSQPEDTLYDNKSPKYSLNTIHKPSISKPKNIVLVPVGEPNQIPFFEAMVQPPSGGVNPYSGPVQLEENRGTKNREYKTKLPVGMSSFFLGGVRGTSGRHWHMPADLVKQLEFMPNLDLPNERYFPEVKPAFEPEINLDPKPEMDESEARRPTTSTAGVDRFHNNSIMDSELDLEAQESRNTASGVEASTSQRYVVG